jgi:hypothetical protein
LIKKDTAKIRIMLTGEKPRARSNKFIVLTSIKLKNPNVGKFIGGSRKQILRPSTTELGNYTNRRRVAGCFAHPIGTSG